MAEEQKKKTLKLPILLSLTISIAIIIVIFYFTIDADTISQLTSTKIRYEFFILAILLNILYWVLWGARLKVLANAMDKKVKIGLWESTKIVIANLFLACITPSMAGGEPVRVHLLKKDGMSLGCSTAAVLGERLLDAIFVLSVLPVAAFLFKDKLSGYPGAHYINIGLWIGVVVFILFLLFFLYSIIRPEKIKAFLIYIGRKLSRVSKKKETENKLVRRISKEVDDFQKGMFCFSGEKIALLKAGILTILFWSTGFMIPSMILLGLGKDPFFIESYAAQVLLLVIIMMPTTPGAAGIAEGGIYILYGALIGTGESSLIGVFVILYRFISYHMNLIAGALFQYRIFKSIASFSMDSIKKEEKESVEESCKCK